MIAQYSDEDIARQIRYPMLTAEQEIILGRQVQEWQELLRLRHETENMECWAESCGLTIEALKRKIRLGIRARDTMIKANTRLVIRYSRKYLSRSGTLDAMDLYQAGILGLTTAVLRFDPTRGYKFSTYATKWIMQAMGRDINRNSRTIRIPDHVHQSFSKCSIYAQEQRANGREVTMEEACQATAAKASYERMMAANAVSRIVSLDAPNSKLESGESLIDCIAAPVDNSMDQLDHQAVLQAVAKLKPAAAELIRKRYGIGGREPMTFAAIAAELNVCREAVRGRYQRAIQQLQLLLSS